MSEIDEYIGECSEDVELVLMKAKLGVFTVVGSLIFIPRTESGQDWCNSLLTQGIKEVWADELPAEKGKLSKQFFVTVITKEENQRKWIFYLGMVCDSAIADIQRILTHKKPTYLSSFVPGAGIIFNGLYSSD